VAIANALQLDRRRHASPFRFNYDFQSHAKFEVAQRIRCCL